MLRASHHFIRYHPQANGLVERTNRVVKAALRSVVGDRPRDWHKYIPELRLALNSAIHRTTGEQPLYLLTGRHAYFPVGLTNDAVFGDNSAFQERLKTARRAAVMASRASHETNERAYNKRAKGTIAPEEGNLGPRWLGPARTSKRFGPVSFEVQHLDSGKVVRAHLNHLRPYHPPQELSYPDDNIGPDEEVEALSAPDDPWVAILITRVRDFITREPATINGDEDN